MASRRGTGSVALHRERQRRERRREGEPAAKHRATVYQQLKDAILAGAIRPMERITENRVAERFGLSRTPVREAFRRLEAEGLILVVPQRGSFVSQPSVQDLLEIYQLRTPLECLAARVAAETLEEAQIEALAEVVRRERARGALEPQALAQTVRASAGFHAVIIATTRNKRMAALLTELQGQVHRVRVLWPSTVARLEETWREHEDLVAAFRARDPDRAERVMREHMERARATTLNRILPISPGL
jgi:DNA-binding GntR family transcriptional regulator